MLKNMLRRAQRLRQTDATWQCTARRAPCWIHPEDDFTLRPYVVLVLDQDTDKARRADILQERPSAWRVFDVLLQAMLRPASGSGQRERPSRVALDDADLSQVLVPRLGEIGVKCEYRASLPFADAALRDMEAFMNGRDPIPGLLQIPGVTPPLAEAFFVAAADYWNKAPWKLLPCTVPVEVRFPPEGRPRFAVTMGSEGEVFGLALYESLAGLQALYFGGRSEEVSSGITALGLVFVDAKAMSFADLDSAERYGWPVAAGLAFPQVRKADGPVGAEQPTVEELAWLAATSMVLPDFVVDRMEADRGSPRGARASYSLSDIYGGRAIALRYPADPLGSGEETHDG